MRYPNHLLTHRSRRGVTQWELCKRVDVPLHRYARMERGLSQPSYADAMRIAAYFGVSPEVLFPTSEQAA